MSRTSREPTTERGRELLAWLKGEGISQHALADRAKVHRQTVWRAIHGDPSAMSVGAIDALLAASVPPRLLGRTG